MTLQTVMRNFAIVCGIVGLVMVTIGVLAGVWVVVGKLWRAAGMGY